MNWRSPPQRAEELGIDPAKLIVEIKAGRLKAVDLATPGSKRRAIESVMRRLLIFSRVALCGRQRSRRGGGSKT